MEECAAVKMEVKKSRFYAHLYHIESPSEVKEISARHHRIYRKAAHHCYASLCTGITPSEITKNDGEVGHPGRALLEVLRKHGLDSHLLIVSRIFGGIKLGPGGVTRAFRDAGEGAALRHQEKIRKGNL